MYPFRAVIVGASEAERATIRREVTNLSVTVEHEFSDIDQAISQRPLLAESACFFLVKVNSAANMDQLMRLNQVLMGKPIVALLNEDSDLSAVLHIQRAGAAQVLMFPLRAKEVRAALDTIARQFGCPSTSSKTIAIVGASEGSGSTTLAINLGDAIANIQHQSCILAELSVHLGRLAFYLKIQPTITVSDLLAGDNALEVNTVNQALVKVTDNFKLLAGPNRTVDRRPIELGRIPSLVGSIRQMAEVVILDLPYTLDDLYFEALTTADQIVLVARPTPPSILALKIISEAVAQKAVGATQHIVFNCYGPRAEEFSEAELRTALAAERIWTVADDPESFVAAVDQGRPLHQEAPRSIAWPGILALARQLTGVQVPVAVKGPAFWPAWVSDLFRTALPVPQPAVATA
jgi:pilus assembly protein CpaE